MSEQDALLADLHAERTKANSLHVDCWACEAGNSEVIRRLLNRLAEAEAAASHMHAVLVRAVPSEDDQAELWRDHWREQLQARAEAER